MYSMYHHVGGTSRRIHSSNHSSGPYTNRQQYTTAVLLAWRRGADVHLVLAREAVHYPSVQKAWKSTQSTQKRTHALWTGSKSTCFAHRSIQGSDRTHSPHVLGHSPEGGTQKSFEVHTEHRNAQSALLQTEQNCLLIWLPSGTNTSKCFSKIFLPFSMIWMVSNVREPLNKQDLLWNLLETDCVLVTLYISLTRIKKWSLC